jgi:Cys-tRNA(Pro)/Cys-tRNA(Cys) deacylase
MTIETPAILSLEDRGVPFRIFEHSGEVHSLEQAAAERGQTPDQVMRSLLFRCETGEFVLVLAAGLRQVNWKTLRKYLGVRRVTMASTDEVFNVTGSPIGAVSPFGHPVSLRVIIDKRIFQLDEISTGSGMRGVGLILRSADLMTALPHAKSAVLTSDDEIHE